MRIIDSIMIANPASMTPIAFLPAFLHSPVRKPPIFELTTTMPMKSAQPMEGPNCPSISFEIEIPHSTTLPEYMTPMRSMRSQ